MNIQMLETRHGSEDGFAVRCFRKGRCYDLADTLARAFISAGWAIEAKSDHSLYEDIIPMYNPYLKNRLLSRITAPVAEPLTLSETKNYLRIDHTDEDSLITSLIVAARMSAENWLRRSLMTQTWKLGCDDCLPVTVELPMGPVNTINSITIINRDASSEDVSSSLYHLNSAKNMLMLDSALTGFQIEVAYATGFGGNASDVPTPIRQGMLCHIAALYENRGEFSMDGGIPEQAIALYMPFRGVYL